MSAGARAATGVGTAVAVAALVYEPAAPAADPKRTLGLLVGVVLLAAAVARPAGRARQVRVAPAALLFLAFVAWSALTLGWGVPAGARDLGSWTAAACLTLVLQRWPVPRARAATAWAALVAGGGAGAIAVFQLVLGARGIFLHGGQGNANWLGLLLAVTMPLTLGLLPRGPRPAAVVSLIAQAAGLVLSHSRVAWAAALVTTVPLSMALSWPRLRPTRAAAAVILGLAVLASAAPPAGAAPSLEPAGDVPIPLAFRGRTWIWTTSADAARATLPLGAGLGGFAHAYLDAQGRRLAHFPPKEASRAFVNATTAHCDWLEVLVDSGLPALLLLALAIASGALAAARTKRSPWLAGAASLLAFAVCALGDSPLRQPGLVLVLGLVFGACPRTVVLTVPAAARAARWAALAAGALLLAQAARGWVSDRRVTAARDASPDAQQALLASAVRIDPTNGEAFLELGLRSLDATRPEEALRALRRSRELLANVGTDVAIGNAEVLLGHPEAAVTAYEAALARSPGSFRAHANISQALVTLGRLDEAEGHLSVAAELWPGNPRLREMMDGVHRARVEREAPPSPP